MKCQATTYSHNVCPIFSDIARVLMYSFRDQLQPVLTGFLRFFAVPVRGSCILKLSGTSPVRGPFKKGNRTETGPDFKALMKTGCPHYRLPSSRTTTRDAHVVFQRVKERIARMLQVSSVF